jgi:lipopolysaccharide transport system ATP-binding protein
MTDIVIKTENLSKYYKLGVINNGTFYRDVQSWLARKTGRPDPHAKIGREYFDDTEDGFWALKDINVSITRGDRVGIIGKNGSGKSTFLKILSRITAPTEGAIKIRGRIASLLEVGTGFHSELTGRENIYLNGAILGMKQRGVTQKIDEIIAFSEIEKHIDTPVKRYSSGMYVRLGFAVAAHLDSDILIADEVLAVGDIAFQAKALEKMRELSINQGRTILFVSHNMNAVETLCNQGILLSEGRNVQSGIIDEIINIYSPKPKPKPKKEKIASWEGSGGDENLMLYKAFIKKNGDQTFLVSVTYEIFSRRDDYVFSLLFFGETGGQLCASTLSDVCTDREYVTLCEPGIHTASLVFNSSIFATGEYYIEFDFAINNIKRITGPEIRLSFDIVNNNQHRHISPARENIIEPGWQWSIDR